MIATLFVAAARKCLSVGRKYLSIPLSLDVAVQVLAVDLGLKPALLYDINSSSAEQVQQYLITLQSAQLVSRSLVTLVVSGNIFIVNLAMVKANLEQLLDRSSVAVIDVCHSLEKPSITDALSGDLKSMTQDLLAILSGFAQLSEVEKPLYIGEQSEKWNLCTLFGILLGYPVTYWFDQNKSFENCLAMTPLTVTTASVTWQAGSEGHRCCLYSFSVPAALHEATQSALEEWTVSLQERFQQQTVLKDLSVCKSVVTLPSVCL
uniref:Zgc:112163 n=1 Tax=Myripristis murdjan TaxID=586833 RepID=A0A667XA13_9TELE